MRPLGEIALALHSAATEPGTVRQFCERAQVAYGVGRYTASRMVQRGELVMLGEHAPARQGPGRPASLLVAADAARAPVCDLGVVLSRSFWEQPSAGCA